MQMKPVFRQVAVILTLIFLSSSGCSRSPAPRFYTLSPIQDQGNVQRSSAGHHEVVGIGPVKLPDYLDQSQIVTRTGDNQVLKAEFERWAGPLKNNFSNILAENLGSSLPGAQIRLYPWQVAEPVDYQVTVEVSRFDGRLGDGVRLESRWSLLQGPEKKLVKARRSTISEPVTGPDYTDLVAAQSRALGQLSREIAQAIKTSGRN